MGGLNVKITMIEQVLRIIAPHPCSGCTKIGPVLCNNCKYDIIHEPFVGCILCGKPETNGICLAHGSNISRSFTVSTRTDTLKTTINRLKFSNTKAAAWHLASLFNTALPVLPSDIQVIPIPTVTSHIRQRGYDHIDLIAKHFANFRKLSVNYALVRQTNATQHTVGKSERILQSKQAFKLKENMKELVSNKTVLLIDDIVTTGSTLQAAANVLKDAGATVWVATLAYQPLD